MAQKGPGKAHRDGISIMELADIFPNEESAIDRPCSVRMAAPAV